MTIVEFLTARLDEREPSVQLTIELTERAYPADEFVVRWNWARLTEHKTSGGYGHTFEPGAPTPAETLAEIAAKRAILAEYERAIATDEAEESYDVARATTATVMALYGVLCHHAAVFSEHADYQQEWKP